MTATTIEHSDVQAGDKVRATRTVPVIGQRGETVTETVTGTVRITLDVKRIGNKRLTDFATIELLDRPRPTWHDALVVRAGGKVFANWKDGTENNWALLDNTGGLIMRWHTPEEVAANGRVEIVVNSDGTDSLEW